MHRPPSTPRWAFHWAPICTLLALDGCTASMATPSFEEPRGPFLGDDPSSPPPPLGPPLAECPSLPCNSTPPFEYGVGTQAIGSAYRFTKDSALLEAAKGILAMGSTLIKFDYDGSNDGNHILAMPFRTYFLWWKTSGAFRDGMTRKEADELYRDTYALVQKLLRDHDGSGKTFFLGHWEGDWLLMGGIDDPKEPSPKAIQGMKDWLDTRQRAVDDAKRDTPHNEVQVYHYVEVNRVRDALAGKARVVNAVLPHSHVDYVSYSSYEVQSEPYETVADTLDYIEARLPPKRSLSGRRVFVGEFGIPARTVGYDPTRHEAVNRAIIAKFLTWGAPYVLYWEYYNNEVLVEDPRTGQVVPDREASSSLKARGRRVHRGFWLVDDKNRKQPLYFTFQGFYRDAARFVDEARRSSGAPPSQEDYQAWSRGWWNRTSEQEEP